MHALPNVLVHLLPVQMQRVLVLVYPFECNSIISLHEACCITLKSSKALSCYRLTLGGGSVALSRVPALHVMAVLKRVYYPYKELLLLDPV